MADARDSSEIEQWIIINQMGAKPWTSDWQARKDFPFFLNPPFSSRYDGALLHCRRAIRNGWWGNERGVRGGGEGEGGGNDRRGRSEDRTLQERERVLRGLTDSREAPSYANYLALVSSYLYISMQFLRVAIYTRGNECVRARKTYELCVRCLCATDKSIRIPRCQSTISLRLPCRILRFLPARAQIPVVKKRT